ncbi:hypothetical protein [Spiroplasma floricola]|uniref:Uncharacterized protein n=1 Tax=Spiroplasma floricola 23-6 TaxID=1336749 RepID=A0A2K8SEX9_9MOLU|nr:hypothetical protein [Spiroplasma floricola]AUB31982.1 hypothetical protein SFLOR_v1c09340 [Spiroplasma floricola 23-6]
MNFDLILKNTVEELLNYFNEDCFKNLKLNGKDIRISVDNLFEKISTDNFEGIDLIIDQLNQLRQENQDLLTTKKANHIFYASTEILLSSATEGFRKIKEAFHDLNFLKYTEHEKNLIDLNEKFVVRKLASNSQRVINKYENLSFRFINNEKISDFLNSLNKISKSENVSDILCWAKEVLLKQDEIKRLDYFINYDALVDEYGWIHDIVKLSSANAEFMGLIVNIEIFSNVINQKSYKENKVRA